MSSMLVRIASHWFSASLLSTTALLVVPDDFGADLESPPQPASASSNAATHSSPYKLLQIRRRNRPGVSWTALSQARRTARGACLLLRNGIVVSFSWRTRNSRHRRVRARFAGEAVVSRAP